MDRVLDVDALALEQVGELAHLVLRLRDRQAVAGDDDDRLAYASMTATSSAVVARTVRSVRAARRAGRPRSTLPNAPKSTFAIERFIASPIIIVSSVPEAPTSGR